MFKFNKLERVAASKHVKVVKKNFALATFKHYQKETLNLIKNDRLKLVYMD